MSDVLAAVFHLSFRVEFLVPIADNDGQLFPSSLFEEFESYVRGCANGFTCGEALVRGDWFGCGDRLRAYYVNVATAVRARDLMLAIERFVITRFDQQEAYVWVQQGYSLIPLGQGDFPVTALSTAFSDEEDVDA